MKPGMPLSRNMPKPRNSIEATKMLGTVKKIYNVFEDPDSDKILIRKLC